MVKSINTCFDDVKTSHVMQESTFTQDEGRFAVNSEVSGSFFVIFLGIKFNFCEKAVNGKLALSNNKNPNGEKMKF